MRYHSPTLYINKKPKSILSSLVSYFVPEKSDVYINFNEFRSIKKKPNSPQGFIYDSLLTFDPLNKHLILLYYSVDEEDNKIQMSEVKNFPFFFFYYNYLLF